MTKSYDAIVIGAGHNGLTTAAYLARAGHTVLVLERRNLIGGGAVTEEIYPGFRYDTCAHSGQLRPDIVRDLDLARHGLQLSPGRAAVVALLPPDHHATPRYLLLSSDVATSAQSIQQFSPRDAEAWPRYAVFLRRVSGFIEALHTATPPRIPSTAPPDLRTLLGWGMKLRGLGKRDVYEALRVLPMSVAEFLDEWFASDVLKGALGTTGVSGLFQGPRSAGTAYVLLHHTAGSNGLFKTTVPGGVGRLTEALAAAARQFGVEVRTDAEVERVQVRDGRATGVALRSGEEIGARVVVSNLDPRRTFLQLVEPPELEAKFVRQVRNLKLRGAVAKVNLALGELPRFAGLDHDRSLANHPMFVISPSLDYLEHAYDDAKYGAFSDKPYLEVMIPTLQDASRAPAGRHVMSVVMQYAPYRLRGGDWREQRERLGDAVVDTLAEYAPNVRAAILHRQVLTPLDLEETYGFSEGNIHHGELTLDQVLFMRPVPGWAQYRTPIRDLYLCGAGAHPGGGIGGASGRNAARQVVTDLRAARRR